MLGGRSGNLLNSARPIYSFPELKNAEILQCMEDLRISLQESDLNKPTIAVAQRIFEAFVEIFMGVGRDQMGQQPAFSLVETLEHPDLHVESISLIAFYRIISRLMFEVGIEDFSLRDLIKPEAPRLRIILSAVINFAKFREEQLAVFEEFSRRADEAAEKRTKLSKRHDELTHKIGSLLMKQHEEAPAVAKIKEEMGRLVQTLKELKKEQVRLSSSLDDLKDQKSTASQKLAQSQFLVGNMKQECTKLKSRIVHSPEKLLQIIAEMNANISHEKTNISQLERKSRELQMKLESLVQLEQELLRTLQGMECLLSDLQKRDELVRKVSEERDSIERQHIASKDLAIKDTQMCRQLSAAQEKLSRLQKQQQERHEKISIRLKTLQEEYQVVAEDRTKASLKIEQSEKIIKDFESRMNELRRSHESEVASMRSECVSLKARVIAYANEVKKSFVS